MGVANTPSINKRKSKITMQYSFTINQIAVIENQLQDKLDIVDVALFDFISKLMGRATSNKECIEGIHYTEVRAKIVARDCPFLHINNRETFNKRMNKLVSAGLLIRYPRNQQENKSLYAQGANYDVLYFDNQSSLTPCQQPLTPHVSDNLHPLSAVADTTIIKNNHSKETKPIGLVQKAEPKPKKLSLEERMEAFRVSLIPFVENYGKEMIRAFYNYWSEPTLDGKKMKWELKETFELKRRLLYWYNREQTKK